MNRYSGKSATWYSIRSRESRSLMDLNEIPSLYQLSRHEHMAPWSFNDIKTP